MQYFYIVFFFSCQFIKGILQDLLRAADEKRPQFSIMSIFDMIVIHRGVLTYPVEDPSQNGLISSKYRFLEYVRHLKHNSDFAFFVFERT